MSFWQTPGPFGDGYPWARFDINAARNFSFDWSAFVASAGEGLALVNVDIIEPDGKFAVSLKTLAGNVLTFRLEKVDQAADLGRRLPFTLRATLSDGQTDDRTFLLEMRQR